MVDDKSKEPNGKTVLPKKEAEAGKQRAIISANKTLDILATALKEKLDPEIVFQLAQKWKWSPDHIKNSCGYWDGDRGAILDVLDLNGISRTDEIAQAVIQRPSGTLFFICRGKGGGIVGFQALELETGEIETIPAGASIAWGNPLYVPGQDGIILTHSPAGAMAAAAAGLPAVALGAELPAGLVPHLKQHKVIFATGSRAQLQAVARKLGPNIRVFDGVTDPEQLPPAIETARPWPLFLSAEVQEETLLERKQRRAEVIEALSVMSDYDLAEIRHEIAKELNLKMPQLNAMLKAARKERESSGKYGQDEIFKPHGEVELKEGKAIFEMIIRPDGKTAFCVKWPDDKIEEVFQIETEEGLIKPLEESHPMIAGDKPTINFCSGLEDYGDFDQLIEEIRNYVSKWSIIDEQFLQLSVLYILSTWFMDCLTVFPLLARCGTFGAGKSRWLAVMHELCFRSSWSQGKSTVAALRRKNKVLGPLSMCLDELNFPPRVKLTEKDREMIDFLIVGYEHSGMSEIADVNDGVNIIRYPAYGPKLYTSREVTLPDDGLQSRVIVDLASAQPLPEKLHILLPQSFYEDGELLRNKLLKYRLANHPRKMIDSDIDQQRQDVSPRTQQILLPLRSLFRDRPVLVETIDAIMLNQEVETQEARSESLEARIIEAILRCQFRPTNEAVLASQYHKMLRLSLVEITKRVNEIIDARNAESKQTITDEEGKPATTRRGRGMRESGVNRYMEKLGIRTRLSPVRHYRRKCIKEFDPDLMRYLARRYSLEDLYDELEQGPEEDIEEAEGNEEIPI